MSPTHPGRCPACGGRQTRVEWVDRGPTEIDVVRTCECGAEFVSYYRASHTELTHDPQES